MTKIDIDKLFELYENDEYEGLLELLEDSELKEKSKQYDDLEDFFYEEDDNIYGALYRQIPSEFLEYYCDKAIDTNNIYLIQDEKIKENSIKKYEAKVEKILNSDEETMLKFVENAGDNNKYAVTVARSLSDENKIRVISKIAKEQSKENIAVTIEDENVRFSAIDLIKDASCKANIAVSITNNQKLKLAALDKVEEPYLKRAIAISITDSQIKLNALDKFEESYYKEEIAISIADSQVKLNALDKFKNSQYKKEIALSITDSQIKLQSLEKFDSDLAKMEIANTIDDSKCKADSLDKISNPEYKIEIAKNIDDIEVRLQSIEKFEEEKYKQEIIDSFTAKELETLSEEISSGKNNDFLDKIDDDTKNEIIIKSLEKNTLKEIKKEEVFGIGLPKDMTIGVELESEGEMSTRLDGKTLINNWNGKYDPSLKNGVEVVSPILQDTKEDMFNLEVICSIMNKLNLAATERCGGHIHIGVDYFEGNPKAFQNLSNIWYQCEELFYKMGNEKDTIPRGDIATYAKTLHNDLEDFTEEDVISIHSISDFENMREQLVEKERKHRGLNLGHYGEKGKNTIEFRIPNGTLNPKTIKENIKLFGSLMQVSKEMALNQEFKKEEFGTVMNKDLSEGDKVEAVLNLLFDDAQTKKIYRERWESVRDEKIFDELTEGQTTTFKRGDYSISTKQDIRKVAASEEAIEEMPSVAKEIREEVREREQPSIEDSTGVR